ncbi:MAG TPA: type II secretion system protein GspJ, partial [Methylomirabilota bacterium]|nr:type II secretion system protein GspJ [Methylomirabilota bacterium]
SRGEAPEPVVLFGGKDKRLEFVTQAPPFPTTAPIAFTAVVIALEEEPPVLVIRQRALPNRAPFEEAVVVLRDPGVTSLSFGYLDEGGTWRDTWEVEEDGALPRAVKIAIGTSHQGRPETLPAVTVPLRTAAAR